MQRESVCLCAYVFVCVSVFCTEYEVCGSCLCEISFCSFFYGLRCISRFNIRPRCFRSSDADQPIIGVLSNDIIATYGQCCLAWALSRKRRIDRTKYSGLLRQVDNDVVSTPYFVLRTRYEVFQKVKTKGEGRRGSSFPTGGIPGARKRESVFLLPVPGPGASGFLFLFALFCLLPNPVWEYEPLQPHAASASSRGSKYNVVSTRGAMNDVVRPFLSPKVETVTSTC